MSPTFYIAGFILIIFIVALLVMLVTAYLSWRRRHGEGFATGSGTKNDSYGTAEIIVLECFITSRNIGRADEVCLRLSRVFPSSRRSWVLEHHGCLLRFSYIGTYVKPEQPR